VVANTYLGLVHRHRGEYRRAIDFFRSNVETLTGDRTWERFGMIQLPSVHSRVWMASSLAELGEFEEARALVVGAVRLAESADHPMSRIVGQFGLGDVCLRQGDFDGAIGALTDGLALSRRWNVAFWSPRLASALGVALAQAGRAPEALPLGEEAVHRYAAARQLGGHALILSELAGIYLAARRNEDARRLAVEALELAERNGERGHGAWALRLLGELALVNDNDVEQARSLLDRARGLATELHMRPLIGHCHVVMARVERTAGEDDAAAKHLAAARTLFSEMSMNRWSDEAAEALARLG
jgi:tetratricopeptide (TPR) repeat protein